MAIRKLEEQYLFMPLIRYLKRAKREKWSIGTKKKTKLLSGIKNLDRSMVEQLETMQIFDTSEFLSVHSEIGAFLGKSEDRISEMVEIVNNETKQSFHPIIDLEMRDNIAFVAVSTDEYTNALAMIAENILFSWSNPVSEGWMLVKHAFDNTVKLLNQPELLSCTFDGDHPMWLHVSDISTYIGGLDPLQTIYSQVELMGFPIKPDITKALDLAQNRVLKLKFLRDIALQNYNGKKSLI